MPPIFDDLQSIGDDRSRNGGVDAFPSALTETRLKIFENSSPICEDLNCRSGDVTVVANESGDRSKSRRGSTCRMNALSFGLLASNPSRRFLSKERFYVMHSQLKSHVVEDED